MKHEELIEELRERFYLPIEYFNDDEVFELTDGTYGRAIIELQLKCADFGICIKDAVNETRLNMHQDIDKFIKRIFN